ncbi:MAG: MFS transporter, partial [Chitinophagaceae bacterium]|nr:MFS transporter [Chitinophagaceae bacterium]
ITFGEIFAMPFMNAYWIGRTQTNNRGRYAALYTAAWSLAQIAAPTIGSQVAEHAGFNTLWWMVGVVCVVIIVMAFFLQSMHTNVSLVGDDK